MDESLKEENFCVVIPAYREEARIGDVVNQVNRFCRHVIVVDDGSKDQTSANAKAAGAQVVRHDTNCGKGAALNTGFALAREMNAEFVITMDADGQHDPEEIPQFVEAYRRTGIPVLIGNRMAYNEDMPWIRKLTNRGMSRILSRTMDQYVPDTQCGYRLYRSDIIPFVSAKAQRFAAESETLLHVADRGIRIDSVRVRTIYNSKGSNINPLIDTVRFLSMLHQYLKARKMKGTAL